VLVDQFRLCDGIALPKAVTVVFAAYYVLNIQYPEGGSNTLEFMQRLVDISRLQNNVVSVLNATGLAIASLHFSRLN
jgi:hypothetical protein